MKQELAEIIAKAARDPDAYADLGVRYERGHELSGVTRFEVRAGGAFTLRAVNARKQRASSFEGHLEPAQRTRLLSAIDEAALLEIPPSTRPIGDDEVPIIVELGYDDAHFRLPIWAEEAGANPRFQTFEHALWKLFAELSDGHIRR